MSIIKSFSVGDGDMFYIFHNSDNFTIIDCYINSDELNELKFKSSKKGITRFISTHSDEDHIKGLKELNNKIYPIFYCVENKVVKSNPCEDFIEYCKIRDSSASYYLEKDFTICWLNKSDEKRKSSGLFILWPITSNEHFKEELEKVKNGESPNNISPIIQYSLENGVDVMWMGDLETPFMEKIENELKLEPIDILFAPHHGRSTGSVPKSMLDKLQPKLIIVGEAPSKDLEYYSDYNTITQNTAGDILFDCSDKVDIYVSNENYSEDFLKDKGLGNYSDEYNNLYYIGTL